MKNAPTKRKVNLVEMHHLNHYGIGRTVRHGNYGTWLDHTCNIEGSGVDIVPASGRARCRLTGDLIPKGKKAITGLYDFTGAGSYTCQKIYIDFDAYKDRLLADAVADNRGTYDYNRYEEGLSS